MTYAHYPLALGILTIGQQQATITSIRISHTIPPESHQPTTLTDMAYQQIIEYLNQQRHTFDVPYQWQGTSFQEQVWEAVCKIPYGETRSYQQLAKQLGRPNASRAVGLANQKNPLLVIVPCHRVLGSDGSLRGYAGGLAMKKMLLQLERSKGSE